MSYKSISRKNKIFLTNKALSVEMAGLGCKKELLLLKKVNHSCTSSSLIK